MKSDLGIYVHIPFCLSKCRYCDFCSGVQSNLKKIDEYVDALCLNIVSAAKNLQNRYIVDTVFIGGGTPSILSSDNIRKIVESIAKFDCDIKEFTIEGNPNTLTSELMSDMRKYGINRLSVGLQTINDEILDIIGRKSKMEHAEKCLDAAVKIFDNVSCDIMVGLPKQTMQDIDDVLDFVLHYDIKHISCYSLQLEDGTPLKADIDAGKYVLPSENVAVDMYDAVLTRLEREGFNRYEVSNFAKKGFESKHNMRYWERKAYLGVGTSSSSLVDENRFECSDDIETYIKEAPFVNYNDYTPKSLFCDLQKLSEDERLTEYIMLGLRCENGVDLSEVLNKLGVDVLKKYAAVIEKNKHYLSVDGSRLKILPKYMYIMNSIILDFYTD